MNYLITIFLVLIIAIIGYQLLKNVNLENFVPYKRKPFNIWETGSTPLNYYTLPAYKKPYRYPFKYHTTYPYSYLRYYPTDLKN